MAEVFVLQYIDFNLEIRDMTTGGREKEKKEKDSARCSVIIWYEILQASF